VEGVSRNTRRGAALNHVRVSRLYDVEKDEPIPCYWHHGQRVSGSQDDTERTSENSNRGA